MNKRYIYLLPLFLIANYCFAQSDLISFTNSESNFFIIKPPFESSPGLNLSNISETRGVSNENSLVNIGVNTLFLRYSSFLVSDKFLPVIDNKFHYAFGVNLWLQAIENNYVAINANYILPSSADNSGNMLTTSGFLFNVDVNEFLLSGTNKDNNKIVYMCDGLTYNYCYHTIKTNSLSTSGNYSNLLIDAGLGAKINIYKTLLIIEAKYNIGLFELPIKDIFNFGGTPSFFTIKVGVMIPIKT